MDGLALKSTAVDFLKKYRHVLLIFLIGLFLMFIPEESKPEPDIPVQEIKGDTSLEASLSQLLSKLDGAGKTEVLLSEAAGMQTHYQMDEDISTQKESSDQRRDTVLVTDAGREETGLVRRVDPPVYMGAIILCQGADNARVRLSIVEAVSNATGLTTDKITVLKMK